MNLYSARVLIRKVGLVGALGVAPNSTASEVITLPQTSLHRCVDEREAGACYELGYLYAHTSKPGDIALGHQYLRYGCKLGFKRKCTQGEVDAQSTAYLRAKKEWDAVKQQALNAMDTLKIKNELNCEKGDAKACGDAGIHYFYLAPTTNPEKARAMYAEGCRRGDKGSCDSLDLIDKGIVRIYDVEM